MAAAPNPELAARIARYARAIQTGQFTPDEARAMDHEPPDEEVQRD